MIYEVIRRDGEEELARPTRSLVWSGIAAEILISFLVLGEAVFRTYMADTPTRSSVENLGYSFGFLLVILGRTARLWAIVLGAFCGCLALRRNARASGKSDACDYIPV